jgi:protein-serine/threonine kinase|uniref:non-specific serine/threonine protein kinase n=1 Tax=Karlodinium veneficum TaxID=407301 RepID=A3E4E5_KARVE|nr:cAMP-dependent protein kinase [Karlodinium veneficum]ACU45272.1 cAMP-dependent protein kinase [Karlodinium veneficum]|mmetsp:Transcript_102698/g.162365  ORF Transcript_102698/g.162365 Transcript_102698/m.162365 type:complete len:329 (+) Transcript_102698:67-1053(+)
MAAPKLEDFEMLKVLGKGSYGKVVLVKRKGAGDQEVYAMKMLRKDHIVKRNQVEHTQAERNVLQVVKHPFIVELHAAFQTPKKLHFVLEFCAGGELFFHLSRAGRFSEGRCKFYACEILLALQYLHSLNIIYRDLKPENLLLDHEGHAKITDFGLSKEGIEDNVSAKTLCGTPEYLAPEILRKEGHGKAVDWYSFGALIYEMLTGLPPFYTKDREKLFERIKMAQLTFPSYVSSPAKGILTDLLHKDPNKRLGGGRNGGEDIKAQPFFSGVNFDDVYSRNIVPPFKPDVSGPADTKYFDKEFTNMPAVNSEVRGGGEVKKFEGFTYAA